MRPMFNVEFFGVRGSIAVAAPDKMEFGCNTSCLLVTAGTERIILDMGTGAVQLGKRFLEQNVRRAFVLLGHFHYDHLEGIPFFHPFFQEGEFHIYGEGRGNVKVKELIDRFMQSPFLPIDTDIFSAKMNWHTIDKNSRFYLGKDIYVSTAQLGHPNGCTGYSICFDGRKLVYLVDYEHESKGHGDLTEFCRNAELLIYDAPYTETEYRQGGFQGWGHSTYEAGISLSKEAGVKKIIFTHHGIERTDQELSLRETEVKKYFSEAFLSKEGMIVQVGSL